MGKDSDSIPNPMAKYKRRMKRMCICSTISFLICLIAFVIGVVLLVYYLKNWNSEKWYLRAVPITGVVLVVIGSLALLIGVGVAVTLCIIASRLEKAGDPLQNKGLNYHKTSYEYGKAPYPQQPPAQPLMQPGAQPGAPAAEPSAPVDNKDVHVDITPHNRF